MHYMNRLKYILQHRYYLKIICFIFILGLFLFTLLYKKISIYNIKDTEFIGYIYKIKETDTKRTIYIKGKEKLIINDYNKNTKINLGDEIKVTGSLKEPQNNTIPNLFNYKKYLYNNQIYYLVDAKSIKVTKYNTKIIYYLRKIIQERISTIKNKEFIQTFILGDNTLLDDDLISSFRTNGISHLFSISGMHISLFAALILYILKRLSYNNYFIYSVVILFLLSYVYLIGFSPSATRSLIMYILFSINKLLNLHISKFDLMLLVLVIILLINPFYIYNVSFQYSYLISFTLVVFSSKLKYIKSNILKSLYISFISFLISFPICINNFFEVNFLSIIYNIFMIPLISLIIFPLSIISFIITPISYILNIFTTIFSKLSLLLSEIRIGIISFQKPSIFIIIIYYIFIFLFIHNKKNIYIFLIILLHKTYPYINNTKEITYLDVGQGDSIVLKLKYNKTILIDTGGNPFNKDYNISLNKTIPYLKSKGIDFINTIILTHGDYDHMGEAINLVNNFKVEKVIFNCGEFNDLEKELFKVLDKKKIKYYSCIKELNIDNNKLYFLQTSVYNNENDNSNVIYTELNGYKFMFMGDAGVDKEKDILDKYNISSVDVLKVGHHGSKTSSSKEFINEISPKYSVISVGKNNRYGHPNKEVLDNLEQSKIYRTDRDGSIMFKIKNNKLKIETCSP